MWVVIRKNPKSWFPYCTYFSNTNALSKGIMRISLNSMSPK